MKSIVNSKFKSNLSSNLSRGLIKLRSKGVRSVAGIRSHGLNYDIHEIVNYFNISKM
jgi:hypothetical protein